MSLYIKSPLLKEFNSLKKFFRTYESPVSKMRIRDFKNFTAMINSSGDQVAFDLLGSVNFGQAEDYSDVDVIIYLDCDEEHEGECTYDTCRKFKMYKKLLTNTLVYQYAGNTYKVDFVDCINLRCLDRDINNNNQESITLMKFGFYRSICRGINKKIFRPFENKIVANPAFMNVINSSLEDFFHGLISNSQHSYSFRKYIERVSFRNGKHIPDSIIDKIKAYLDA
jgi:hypothetical protein